MNFVYYLKHSKILKYSAQGKAYLQDNLILFRNIWVLTFFAILFAIAPTDAQSTFEEKAVLITGTSSGIGLRMTELLSQNGFFVYAGVRTPEDYAPGLAFSQRRI